MRLLSPIDLGRVFVACQPYLLGELPHLSAPPLESCGREWGMRRTCHAAHGATLRPQLAPCSAVPPPPPRLQTPPRSAPGCLPGPRPARCWPPPPLVPRHQMRQALRRQRRQA